MRSRLVTLHCHTDRHTDLALPSSPSLIELSAFHRLQARKRVPRYGETNKEGNETKGMNRGTGQTLPSSQNRGKAASSDWDKQRLCIYGRNEKLTRPESNCPGMSLDDTATRYEKSCRVPLRFRGRRTRWTGLSIRHQTQADHRMDRCTRRRTAGRGRR